MEPGDPPGIDHVTAVFGVLATEAANICPCPGPRVTDGGITDTEMAGMGANERASTPAATAPSVTTAPGGGIRTREPAANAKMVPVLEISNDENVQHGAPVRFRILLSVFVLVLNRFKWAFGACEFEVSENTDPA